MFSKSVQEDYNDSVEGKDTRYQKKTSPDERADLRRKKQRKLNEYFASDGRPPDQSKDVPVEPNTVKAYFIPFGFIKQLPSFPNISITATNICSIDTVLTALFLIQKSYDQMFHYFIREGGRLNSTLNLIETGKFADA